MSKTIQEWEMIKGIDIEKPLGFGRPRNKALTKQYTESEFRKKARKSIVTCKTEEGIKFLKGGKFDV